MKKRLLSRIISLVMGACLIFNISLISVNAYIDWNCSYVYISYYGQVVDSITYNGIEVQALYAPYSSVSGYDSDTTLCCAAFVKRFYSSVFGIGINNLYNGAVPNIYSGSGEFYETPSPSVGDIARGPNHWAIVKSVSGSTITLIEQNAWNDPHTSAAVGRKIVEPEDSYTYFHYSGNSTAVDLGTDFYAVILHNASWTALTAESNNNNVDLTYETGYANQYWKFYLQSDGSYKIVSASSGKCLDVLNASTANGANIQVCGDNGLDAQRWYIYRCGNGYQLRAKCTDCVMEMNAWYFLQGVNVVSETRDGSDAEIFAIYMVDFNNVAKTSLNVTANNGVCNFTWLGANACTNYNIKVWNGDTVKSGEAPMNYWNVQNNSYSVNLGDGTFTAYIESYNALGDYVQSSPITFTSTVSEFTPAYTITQNNHTYAIYNTPVSWEKANETAKSLGGYLVSVTSESEQEIIEQLLEYGTLRGYSIGAKRVTDDSDKWSWVSGESFEYTNWASGEPNNTYNKEYYACVYNVDSLFGKWNDSFNAPIEGICSGMIVEFENGILGDINNDGVVNVMDATELQKHIAGTTTLDDEALLRADVDSDDSINIKDATLIQKYSASLITEF